MIDRKKVIKGLRCLSDAYDTEKNCDNCEYDFASCVLDVSNDALQLLKDQELQWISVNDRLPGTYEPFYAACKSLIDDRENWVIEGIYKCTSFGGPWGVPLVEMGKAEVYAWMPKKLPEPPKE